MVYHQQTYLLTVPQINWFEMEKSSDVAPFVAETVIPFETPSDVEINPESTVDETFSYIDSVHNLEQLLNHRSSANELSERNIIKDAHVSPALQATSESIRRKKLSEHLQHKLEHRRSKDDLISVNIIKPEMKHSSNAFSLQPAQTSLRFHKTQIELNHKLVERPTYSTLLTSNVITADVAPNLQAAQRALKFQQTSIVMVHKLEHRPAASVLVDHNILKVGGIDVASNLHAAQQQLKFNITAAALDHKLENRPKSEMLVGQRIMMDETEPKNTVDVESKPEIQLYLTKKLERRPSKDRLKEVKILQ